MAQASTGGRRAPAAPAEVQQVRVAAVPEANTVAQDMEVQLRRGREVTGELTHTRCGLAAAVNGLGRTLGVAFPLLPEGNDPAADEHPVPDGFGPASIARMAGQTDIVQEEITGIQTAINAIWGMVNEYTYETG